MEVRLERGGNRDEERVGREREVWGGDRNGGGEGVEGEGNGEEEEERGGGGQERREDGREVGTKEVGRTGR